MDDQTRTDDQLEQDAEQHDGQHEAEQHDAEQHDGRHDAAPPTDEGADAPPAEEPQTPAAEEPVPVDAPGVDEPATEPGPDTAAEPVEAADATEATAPVEAADATEATAPVEAADATEATAPVEEAAPRRGGRSRRATRPTSTPAALDVLAELGAPRTESQPAAGDERRVASFLDRIVFEAPGVAGGDLAVEDEPDVDDLAAPPTDAEPDPEADLGARLPVTALLFQAPEPVRQRRRAQAPAGPPVGVSPFDVVEADADAEADVADLETEEESETEGDEVEAESSSAGAAPRRRRRRGGRGRRRPTQGEGEAGSGADEAEEDSEEEAEEPGGAADVADDGVEDTDEAGDDGADATTSSSRRRRRRRSRGARPAESEDAAGGRPARNDEVTALKGSTRLEAKRQRRREGRDAGRRRTIVTEAEFLARRESVDRAMVVRERDGRTQIAVVEDGVLVEHFVARRTQTSMVGNVYLGRVQNVLPSMEAAFVDLGKGRNAVLYAGEVNWDATGMEGQPRRIEQALSAGDAVMVQVTKDPIGHKGARLTSQITLAGRYLVLVPGGGMTGISRKLPDTERARLKRVLREIVTDGAGVIVRTAAEGASEEELRLDVARLQTQWAEIQKKSTTASAPALLSSEPDLAIRVVRDVFNGDFGSVTIAGDDAWRTISDYISSVAPDLAPRLHRWTEQRDVFAAHRIDEQLAKALDRKVWLPSGGSLVIDRTEAMTVIDVNTGKFTGTGGTLEETVTRNNLEAAEEIVRQLRLRDVGGIIVIDFIDMVLESNRDLVLRRLVECLGRDRTRHQVAEVTSLGLVQMTRKRVGQGLLEAFSETCDCCSGRGYVIHSEPVEKAGSTLPDAAAEESTKQASGGSRRRGRRGGENAPRAATPRPAPGPDPDAVAAREAMKAALATIAAASAHAHEESEHAEAETGEAVEVDVTDIEPAEVEGIDFDALRASTPDDGDDGDAPAAGEVLADEGVADEPSSDVAAWDGPALDESAAETLDFDGLTAGDGEPSGDPGSDQV